MQCVSGGDKFGAAEIFISFRATSRVNYSWMFAGSTILFVTVPCLQDFEHHENV